MWNYYAADRRARLNLGIRRRLAPLMENDRRKIELLNALLISMPGTPVFYYGDEIGMGDNVFLGDRDGVRTPMQWSFDRNGGFSRADPARLYLPPIMDLGLRLRGGQCRGAEPLAFVAAELGQAADRGAPLAARFRPRQLRFLYPSNRKVIAYLRDYGDEIVLCVANLSRSPQAVELDLSDWRGRQPVELLGRSAFPPIGELPYLLTLQGYSFFWFELPSPPLPRRRACEPRRPNFSRLVMPHGWPDLFRQHNLPQLESDVIPAFLPRQRWFGAKDQRVKTVSVLARGEITRPPEDGSAPESFIAGVVEAQLARGERAALFPAAGDGVVVCRDRAAAGADSGDPRRVAAVPPRGSARRCVVAGRLSAGDDGRDPARGDNAARRRRDPLPQNAATSTRSRTPERLVARRSGAEQSNSSIIFDDYGMLKIYRRLQPGPHPEIEMSRFLVERAGFANTPPLLAFLELDLDGSDGPQTHALGVLFGFVRNQGDGWTQALDYLTRYLDDAFSSSGTRPADLPDPDVFFLSLARQLGIRTAEMHRALAEQGGDDPDFAPEPITAEDVAQWRRELEAAARRHAGQIGTRAGQIAGCGAGFRRAPHGRPRQPFPPDPHADPGRDRGAKDPLSRRFSPRPGSRREERLLHHRFRGRAGAAAGRTPAQEFAVARCRRHDPLVRLRQLHCGAAARRSAAGGRAENAATGGSLAAPGGRRLPRRLSQGDARLRGLSGEQEAGTRDDCVLYARKGGLRGFLRAGEPAGLGRHSAERRPRHSGHASRGPSVLRRPDPQVEAIVEARHGDPFSFLGMHKAAGGISVRAMLPGAQEVAVVEPATGKLPAKGVQLHRDGLFVATIRRPQGAVPLSAAGLERRRRSTNSTTSIAFRRCSASSTSICSPRAIISRATASSARTRCSTKVSRASPLRYGRRMPAGSASSAISTPGTAGACRCAMSAGSGSCSCRACAPAISTNTRSSAPMVSFCR